MAEKGTDGEKPEPTLELPSLFGKRKRRRPDPVEETPPAPAPEPEPEPASVAPRSASRRASRPAPRRSRRAARGRTSPMPPLLASLLTGLLVGAAGTALTYASLRGCEMLRGTESCGGSGLLLLVGIVALMVLGGTVLLKAFGMSEPGGVSFLAIGLTCVVVLVALMESVFSPWMFVVVPLLCAASYALAHWVTTRFVDTSEPGPGIDVR